MVTIPWPDWVSEANPYAEAARPFYIPALCRFRRDNPWLWQRINWAVVPAFGGGNAGFNNLALDAVCPPLDDAAQPLLGGQCSTRYRVICRTFDENGGNTGADRIDNIDGPITRVETPTAISGGLETVELLVENGAGVVYGPDPVAAQPEGVITRIVWSIERQDGLPDDCGNQEPWPVPPVPPVFPQPVEVNLPGGQSVEVDIDIPSFDPGNWPDFTFEPTIDVGGVPITISPEGITFPDNVFPPFPDIPAPSVNLAPTLDAIANLDASLSGQIDFLDLAIQEVRGSESVDLTEIIELIRRCCCEEGTTTEAYSVASSTTGGTFGLDPDTFAVVVTANTPLTDATPIQAGAGSAPDVYYWGWWSVGYGEVGPGTRIPLQHITQSAQVGPGAASVTVSPHYQNTCSIIGIKEMEQQQ